MKRRQFLKAAGAMGAGLLVAGYIPNVPSEYELPVSEDDRLQAEMMESYKSCAPVMWRGCVETVRTPELEGCTYGMTPGEEAIKMLRGAQPVATARYMGRLARNTEHWAVVSMLVDYVASYPNAAGWAPISSTDSLLEYPIKLLTECLPEEGWGVHWLDKARDFLWEGQWMVPPDQEYGAKIVGAITGRTSVTDWFLTLVEGGSKDRWYVVHSDTFLMKIHPDYPRIEKRGGKLHIVHRFELTVHPELALREKEATLYRDTRLTRAKGDDFEVAALRIAKESGWTREEWEKLRYLHGAW